MTRWFLGALCAGAAASFGMSGCMGQPYCGENAQNGVYAIGDPVNFKEAPQRSRADAWWWILRATWCASSTRTKNPSWSFASSQGLVVKAVATGRARWRSKEGFTMSNKTDWYVRPVFFVTDCSNT